MNCHISLRPIISLTEKCLVFYCLSSITFLTMITAFSISQLVSISLSLLTILTHDCETSLSPEPVLYASFTCV